jgi:hypothetical protein
MSEIGEGEMEASAVEGRRCNVEMEGTIGP